MTEEQHLDLILDQIGLDFDGPGIDELENGEATADLSVSFWAVADQYPNNPLRVEYLPTDLPAPLFALHEHCKRHDGITQIDDPETHAYIEENFKARVLTFDPKEVEIGTLGDLGDIYDIKCFRSLVFIPTTNPDLESMVHLNDDINRRIEEVKIALNDVE